MGVAEIKKLETAYRSNRAEFVGVYGRRRVDKYLAKAGLSPYESAWVLPFLRVLSPFQGHEPRTAPRWVGDTEQIVLQAHSHPLPGEKDEIADFLNGENDE